MDLERLEGIIRENTGAFYEIGDALMKIRENKYYHEVLGYETFEEYCKKRWDFGKWYAYKIIESTSVMKQLDNCPIKPTTESQARPLVRLPADQQLIAWQKAFSTAADGKVTLAQF